MVTKEGDKTNRGQLGTILGGTVTYLTNHQMVREWACLQWQEMPIGLKGTAD